MKFRACFILLAGLFMHSSGFSQDNVNNIAIDLKGISSLFSFNQKCDAFQIVDHKKMQVNFFMTDKRNIYLFLLDKNLQLIDSMKVNRPDKNFKEIIGYNITEGTSNIYWSSKDKKKILLQKFDILTEKLNSQAFNLTMDNEVFLNNFSYRENFYITTLLDNALKLYVFEPNGNLSEKIINLKGEKFLSSLNIPSDFNSVFKETSFDFEKSNSVQIIEPDTQTSLVYSAKKRKCYMEGDYLNLTFDFNLLNTYLIQINLSDFTNKTIVFKKKQINKPTNSNSFLKEDKLYQLVLSENEIAITIKSLNDDIIKEYTVKKDEDISFKNSEILQQNAAGYDRVLEKTSQFIRKLNNINPGISVHSVNGKNLVTIGAVSGERPRGGVGITAPGSGFSSPDFTTMPYVYNPQLDNFDTYCSRKVVYINCLFDEEIKHSEGTISKTTFDQIRDFSNIKSDTSVKTLFKMNSDYYFGYYDSENETYSFAKFND